MESVPVVQISAEDYIAKGRRDVLCCEIQSAVDNFQKACELLAIEHGDFHEELALPNLLYGTALLELARSENQLFNEVPINSEKDEDSDETAHASDNSVDENLIQDSESNSLEKNNISNSVQKLDNSDNSAENSEVSKENESTNDNITLPVNSSNNKLSSVGDLDDKVDSPGNDDEEAGEVSTLQLAWEVIEVAKVLFQKVDDAKHQLQVADCLEKLAEISCEKEDHEAAISDLLEALELRIKYANDNNRLISETYFQLGVAYSLLNNIHSANNAFVSSLEYLQQHKNNLFSLIKSHCLDTETEKFDLHKLELQISEITQLMLEVDERRKECTESTEIYSSEGAPLPKSKNLPPPSAIEDISHLIKRKPNFDLNNDVKAKKSKVELSESNLTESVV